MLSLFGLAVLVAVGTYLAQSGTYLTAEIPFAFNADTAHFDAGSYLVNAYSTNRAMLEVKNRDGSGAAFVLASEFESNANSSRKSRLIFNKYGDQYFLSHVWMEDGTLGCKLTPSKKEKEVLKTVEANRLAREVVQIAAR